MHFGTAGQGWLQLGELLLAFVLCSLVGLEREWRQKSAGFRTHTLVGVSAALFMLISKYGFTNVLDPSRVVLDPSRVAAQVVSGIGFIGGGVIFMRRDVVRGLTTAASIWLTAGLGMACGAGLLVLAVATTLFHFIIMFVFPRMMRHFPKERRALTRLLVIYDDGRGILRQILFTCGRLRFSVEDVATDHGATDHFDTHGGPDPGDQVALEMVVKSKRPVAHLIAALDDIEGIIRVSVMPDASSLD